MTLEILYTLAVVASSVALFVSERLRLDVVALLGLFALVLGGILPFEEAVAGFSSPLVLMIAGLFIVGAGLTETGVADWLGGRLVRLAGEGEVRLIVVVMGITALVSAFMSSTGTVAILLPVVGTVAQRQGIPLSRVLLPLAFAAHLGSPLTLVATPPNLVASEALVGAGRDPLRFFSMTPVGLVLVVLGIAYMALVGRRHLPNRATGPSRAPLSHRDLIEAYGIERNLHTLRTPPTSPLVGKTLGDANLRASLGVDVVGIDAAAGGNGRYRPVVPHLPFTGSEVLRVHASPEAVQAAAAEWGLEPVERRDSLELPPNESLVEVVLPRRSALVGKSLKEIRFRDRYRATVLGIRRGAKGEPARVGNDEPLEVGDMLLLKGRRKHLRNLRDERRDLVIIAAPDGPLDQGLRRRPAVFALGITLAMLVVMAFGWLPNAVAVMLAAIALVLAKAVRPADAYQAVNWESVVLVAGMLPLATALERTGATALMVEGAARLMEGASPYWVLFVLVVATSTLGQFVSNTATAVLMAPLAVEMAAALELSPEPLVAGMAVATAASFSTPIASPVNSLVVGPGGYRFRDFAKVGLPLHLLVLAVAMAVVPLLFPF